MPAALPLAGLEFINRGFTAFERQLVRAERLEAKLVDTSKNVAAQSQRTSRSLGILGVSLGAIGGVLLGVTTGLARFGMELQRSEIATETVARITGIATETIAQERRELDALLIPARQVNDMLSRFALNQLDVASSSELAQAALDMSTMSIRTGQRAVKDFTDAVVTQNLMRLREYGIMTQTTKIYKWYGAQIGKNVRQMTGLERSQAIQAYLITKASGLQGAYNQLLETTAGATELFNYNIAKISETLSTLLMPRINAVLGFVNEFLERVRALPAPVQKAIVDIMSLGGVFLSVAGALTLLAPGLKVLIAGLGALPSALGGVVAGFLSMHPAILIVGGAITALVAGIATDFGGLRGLFDRTFGGLIDSLRKAYTESVPWVRAIGSLIWDGLTAAFEAADRFIRRLTGGLVEDDWGFEFDAERFFVGGAAIMGEFAAGLIRGFNEYVLPTVIGIVKAISSFLIGMSPPTEGPLADIEKGGLAIIQAWSHGMGSASLSEVRKLVKAVKEELQQALYFVLDTLFDVETQELALGKALWPLEDALFLVRAAADLITIPLEQQKRVIEDQIGDLEKIAEIERERAEAFLRQLQKQADMMREIIDADEERLEVLDHEIFMETQRNKILGRATSARLLELKSQKMAMKDTVDLNKESLEATEGNISAEEERLEALTTAAEAQIEALQAQVDALNENIEFEEERIRLAEEALRMEEARQAQAQLALLEERRFWEAEQRMASHYLDIIGRVPDEQKKRKKGLEDFIDTWDKWAPKPFVIPDVDTSKAEEGLESMKEKLLAAFWGPIEEQLKATDELLKELREEWATLEYEFKIKFVWPTPAEIGKNVANALIDILYNLGKWEVETFLPWAARLPQTIFDALYELGKWEVETAWPWLVALPGKVDEWLGKVGFKKWFKETNDDLNEFSRGFGETIDKELLYPAQEAFSDWYEETKEDVDEWVYEQIEIAKTFALDQTTRFKEMLTEKKEAFTTWASEMWEKYTSYYADLVMEQIYYIGDTINNWVGMFTDMVIEAVLGLARITGKLIVWLTVTMPTFWADAAIRFVKWLGDVWDNIAKWFEETGIPDMIQHGKDTISSMILAAANWIVEHWEKVTNLGKRIVAGIKKGIKGAWTGFKDWLKEMLLGLIFKLIPAWLKGGSPAMIMAPIGASLVQGMQAGFQKQFESWVPELRAELDFGRRAQEFGAGSRPTVTNNYITNRAPTFSVDASYANMQSEASIRDDMRMMMMLA